jgi:hypothetical protein
MAVTEVKLLQTGASGSAEGTDAGQVRVSYTSMYQAKCGSASDDPGTVLDHFRITSSLPWIGRTYRFGNGFDTSAICHRVHPSLIENSDGIYNVTCDFKDRDDPEDKPSGSFEPPDKPETWTPEIEVTNGTISLPVEYATFTSLGGGRHPFMKDGKFMPVTNSALEPLDPTFEEEFTYKIIRFSTNVREWDDSFYGKFQNTINKEYVDIKIPKMKFATAFDKHYGKVAITAASNITSSGILYWRRTIELAIRGWDRAILDQGTREVYLAGDTKPDGTIVSDSDFARGRISMEVPIKDDDDLPIDKPRLLDGRGKRLKEGQPPVLLGWTTFEESDFSKIKWI